MGKEDVCKEHEIKEIELVTCIETVILASDRSEIGIKGLENPDASEIMIHVNDYHFRLRENDVVCSGFVRAHLQSPGDHMLRYCRRR
jgi:hypothetical protein